MPCDALTCPLCDTHVVPGEAVALLETAGPENDRRVLVVHMAPCALMLLALRRTTRVDNVLARLAAQANPT